MTAAPDPAEGLADRVAVAARSVPGVWALHPGTYGEVATYLPGRRVHGVRLRADRVEVQLVITPDRPAADVAARVRERVAPLVLPRPVDVVVADLSTEQPAPAGPATGLADLP